MDEHLFHREPWLSLAVLLGLGALIYGRTRTAMRVARTSREELERGTKLWKIARGPSLMMTFLALVLLLPWSLLQSNFLGGLLLEKGDPWPVHGLLYDGLGIVALGLFVQGSLQALRRARKLDPKRGAASAPASPNVECEGA